MRLLTALVLALAIGGCKGSYTVACDDDSFCVSGGLHGRCVSSPSSGARYCAFGDVECPSGLRFDPTAGDALAGQCLPLPDGGAGGDGSIAPGGLSFNVAASYATGNSPSAVAFADLDTDTFNDLVVADSAAGTIQVFLANADGSLRAPASYAAGHDPEGIAGGDFNGDGHGDLAVTLAGDNAIAIFHGNPDGTLDGPTMIPAGGKPTAILAVDLTGDGKLDLVTANPSNNSVSSFVNPGDGHFGAANVKATGARPASLAAGDLDGDGHLDIAVATQGGFDILPGKGDGTFGTVLFGNSEETDGVAIGLVDGNGTLDLLAISTGSGHLSAATGNGDGTFKPLSTVLNVFAVAFAGGDFDRDGHIDAVLVTTPVSGGDLSVSIQTVTHTFTAPISYGVGGMPSAVAAGDVNGDGKLDVAVLSTLAHTVTILPGRGDGTFAAPSLRDNNTGDIALTVGTIDHDALPDVAYLTADGHVVSLLDLPTGALGDGFATPIVGGINAIALADVNLDQKTDACMTVAPMHEVVCVFGRGDGYFDTPGLSFNVDDGAAALVADDFTGDGLPDIVTAHASAGTVNLLKSSGDSLIFNMRTTYMIGGAVLDVTKADLDGDGRPDLAVAASNGVTVLLQRTGMLVQRGLMHAGSAKRIVAAKLDGDGTPDIAVIDANTDAILILHGNGDGTFADPLTTDTHGVKPVGLAAADFDGDGHLDLATANGADPTFAAGTSVFLGHGDGTFDPPRSFPVTHGATAAIAAADFNSDGKPDLALLSAGKTTGVTLLLNTTR
jgi:hypothetical protein